MLNNLDALLITNPINIYYLTGFSGLDPSSREAYLIITRNKIYLFTNALYIEQAKKLSLPVRQAGNDPIKKIEIVEISRENPLSKKIKEVLTKEVLDYARTLKLGFEENNVTFQEFKMLEKTLSSIVLVPTQGRVEELRKYKKSHEIDNIRKASQITDKCFTFILKSLKTGVTEKQIAWEIEKFIRENGAELAFSPIVAFAQNSSQPHYSPSTNYQLRTMNLILLDFGAKYNGYCSDMTRVIFFGKATDEQRKVYETVLKAQESVINNSQFCSNNKISGASLDQLSRDIIQKSGLPPYPHSLGHSLGLEIHERPRLSIKKDETLTAEMVFTIEPGVYLEGKFGIRIEDTVCLTKNGLEILTKSLKNIIQLA